MAPTDMKFDEAQESGSQDGSQTLDVQQLLEKHKNAVSARRRKVEAELRQSHKQGFDDLQRRHDEFKVQYEESLKSAQRPYLERLAELVSKKKLLEAEIAKLLDDLQQADSSVTQQLDACIKSRVNALRK